VQFSRATGVWLAIGAGIAGYVFLSKPLEGLLTAAVRFDQQFNLRTAPTADIASIRTATAAHLPRLVPGRRVWVMTRQIALNGHAIAGAKGRPWPAVGGAAKGTGQWEPLIDDGRSAPTDRERAARHAVGEGGTEGGSTTDDVCFPIIMANTPICVLGVSSSPPLTELQRGVLSTAAALLASALKNAQLFTEIHTNSLQDGLTGCFNRTHALDSIDRELRRARRSKHTFSVVMFDIDTFKSVNDRFGHLCGDAVLAEVGARMRATLRTTDLKCRYGGDEFLVILPETPLAGAIQVCESLRKAIEKDPIGWTDGAVSVTASFGVTEIVQGELDPMAVVARSDAALYRSKQAGRNRVTVAEPEAMAV
jgi:diguanylate cyclase (GGDEF)-like protein